MSGSRLRIGLVANPVAGIGAMVALKGSDGQERQHEARRRGGEPRAARRVEEFVKAIELLEITERISWFGWGGLGAEVLEGHGLVCERLGISPSPTSAQDTKTCVGKMLESSLDLIVFVGGDGTAVDVFETVGSEQLCLGIPAGVKMHSGVFAVSAQAAASVVAGLVGGELVAARESEVVDYAEPVTAANSEYIQTKHFGYLHVPEAGGFLQHTKEGGRESEPLALEEICADIVPRLNSVKPLILGPGGTMLVIKKALAAENPTLRGFDVRTDQGEWQSNVDYRQLEPLASAAQVVMSFTRAQGFLFGRGNLELSEVFLDSLSPDRLEVVATRSKVLSLEGRPIMVDCGSTELDTKFSGVLELTAGYEDRLLYRVQGASTVSPQS